VLPGVDPGDWVELRTGRNGYRRALQYGGLRVDHDGLDGMGNHVTMSGQACREAEALGLIAGDACLLPQVEVGRDGAMPQEPSSTASARPPDWSGFARRLLAAGAKASRIDLALDDRAGVLDMATIRRHLDADAVTSRWKGYRAVGERQFGAAATAPTIYLGSPQSDAQLVIYDKAHEQGLPAGEHWVRVELRLRRDRARRMLAAIAERDPAELGELIAGVIRNYICFREASATRIERSPVAGWWARFLGDVAARPLGSDPKLPTMADFYHWVWVQVGPTLRVLELYQQGILEELLLGQDRRLSRRHLAVLAAALKAA
jgi:phage replication initiation protein